MHTTTTIPRETSVPALPLPAAVEDLPNGGARVTIGRIVSTYANAALARDWISAMAHQGKVRVVPPEALPC